MSSQLVKEWQGTGKAIAVVLLVSSVLFSPTSLGANGPDNAGRIDYDLDNDGLIEIDDLADLDEIRNNLDGTSLYSANTGCPTDGCNGFELTTDLDFDSNQDGVMDASDTYWNDNGRGVGEGWLPIGYLSEDGDAPFTAIFEGNSNTIRNLYINRENMMYIGLFGTISESQIRQLSLSGSLTSVTGYWHVGGLIGYVSNSELTRVSSHGAIYGRGQTGGLVGAAGDNNKIYGSYSKGTVQGESWLGGLIGYVGNNNEFEKNFSAVGVIGSDGLGGLLGIVNDNNQIKYCFSLGNVHSRNNHSFSGTGGLIGELRSGNQVVASFSSSVVEGRNNDTGGLIGQLGSNNQITSSYSNGLTTGNLQVGGLIGEASGAGNAITNSYWATDRARQLNSNGESEELGYVGLSLANVCLVFLLG